MKNRLHTQHVNRFLETCHGIFVQRSRHVPGQQHESGNDTSKACQQK